MIGTSSASRAGPSSYHYPPLEVAVRAEEQSAWVIEVKGELDLYTGQMLKKQLESYNDASGNNGHPRRIVYLLPELRFMDASGLYALLDAVDGHGPETITIREPSSQVRRLLELVDLDSLIQNRTTR